MHQKKYRPFPPGWGDRPANTRCRLFPAQVDEPTGCSLAGRDNLYVHPLFTQPVSGGAQGQLRQIVDLAQMRQNHILQDASGQPVQEAPGIFIGQMPLAGQHPLLQSERVGTFTQHARIVIALQDQRVALPEVVLNEPGDPAGVRAVSKPEIPVGNDESDRIRGVVRYGERVDLQAAELEALSGAEFADREKCAELSGRCRKGGGVGMHGHPCLPGEHSHAGNVVVMLMGDQYCRELFRLSAGKTEATPDLHS